MMSVVSIKKESLASIMAANDTESSTASVANNKTEPTATSAAAVSVKVLAPVSVLAPSKLQLQFKAFMQWLLPPVFGLLLLLAVWALISAQAQGLQAQLKRFNQLLSCLAIHFM